MAIRYAAGLACGHLIGTADAAAIVVPLHGQFADDAQAYFAPQSLIIVTVIVVLGTVAVAVGGVANLVPVLRWYVRGQQPDADQRRAAMRLLGRQSMILAAVWAASGVTYLLLNLDGFAALAVPTLLAVVFGGTAAASLSLLLTQRSLRPILLAATQGSEGLVVAPRVLTRLVGMWLVGQRPAVPGDRGPGVDSLERLDHSENRVGRDADSGGDACRDPDRAPGDDSDLPIDIGSDSRGRRRDGTRSSEAESTPSSESTKSLK